MITEALTDRTGWQRLADLGDNIGPRPAGSPQLEQAILWALQEMKRDGLDNVHSEPVKVSKWVRGDESAEMVSPVHRRLPILGLGGSVGTPPTGVEAEILVVHSFDELDAKKELARERIVVYNIPFTTYSETVGYRTRGASRAAKYGASAVLVRSIGPSGFQTLHTGILQYEDSTARIPAAAITSEDAEALQRMQDRGSATRIRLHMEARTLPDADSSNVVAEIRGREKPDEVVVLGAHFDSWDVGTGSSDDGVGCLIMWEALRIMRKLDLRPARTIRVVLFADEETRLSGGLSYRDRHKEELGKHVLMAESDTGVFPPLKLMFAGNDAASATVTEIASLLQRIDMSQVNRGQRVSGAVDIGPSVEQGHLPSLAVVGDLSKYFTIHHSPADTVDKINPLDMAHAVAAVAVLAYVVADMPTRLGEAPASAHLNGVQEDAGGTRNPHNRALP